jgi:hypothetical protein
MDVIGIVDLVARTLALAVVGAAAAVAATHWAVRRGTLQPSTPGRAPSGP